jgi:hypothetical protein
MLTTLIKTSAQTQPLPTVLEQAIAFRSYAVEVSGENFCTSPVGIEGQIPFWLKQNYGNNSNDSYLIDFIKSYYNWLYCGFKKDQSSLTPYEIEDLFDIDKVPDAFIEQYIKTYAPFISISIIQKNSDDFNEITLQNVRSFIKSIKNDFLISKGTEGAYRYLLKTLFDIKNVNIDYPKKYLMRLNGGKFSNISWDLVPNSIIDLPDNFDPNNPIQNDILAENVGYNTENRPNLFGSALNESILPDDNFWQEYSYILTSDASVDEVINYKNTVLAGTHPVGTVSFFEQYVSIGDTTIPSDSPLGGIIDVDYSELPIIEKYLLLYPNISTDVISDPNYVTTFYEQYYTVPPEDANCTDFKTYVCYCCVFNCNPSGITGFFTQHLFPNWDPEIKTEIEKPNGTLGDMTIGSFLELSRNLPSPNIPYKECINDCPTCF